jgi:hypothetical protein
VFVEVALFESGNKRDRVKVRNMITSAVTIMFAKEYDNYLEEIVDYWRKRMASKMATQEMPRLVENPEAQPAGRLVGETIDSNIACPIGMVPRTTAAL